MRRVGLLVRTALALVLAGCSRHPTRPNVILVTVESLRTDHVGVYGGRSRSRPDEPITPNLDAFAREAMVYEDAHAVTSWTLTSHASMFTGLYPSAHKAVRARDRLNDSYLTFAEVLNDHGYQTAGIASGPYLRRAHNLQQGFEIYDDEIAAPSTRDAHGKVTNPLVEAALEHFLGTERDTRRPWLLFVYLWDTHYDYLPPPPYDQTFVGPDCEPFDMHGYELRPDIGPGMSPARLAYVLSQYDGEIRAADELLGRFFASLKSRGLWDDSAIIVTADHGEEFFDHGEKGHKHNLYAETVHVPLLVKYPRGAHAGRDPRLVSHVDLFPTILELAGVSVPPDHPGHSLLAAPDPDRAVAYELIAEWFTSGPRGPVPFGSVWSGIRQGTDKLLARRPLDAPADATPTQIQLFDVAHDPTDQHDRAADDPSRVATLSALLGKEMALAADEATRHPAGDTANLSPAELERLRALGYVK